MATRDETTNWINFPGDNWIFVSEQSIKDALQSERVDTSTKTQYSPHDYTDAAKAAKANPLPEVVEMCAAIDGGQGAEVAQETTVIDVGDGAEVPRETTVIGVVENGAEVAQSIPRSSFWRCPWR